MQDATWPPSQVATAMASLTVLTVSSTHAFDVLGRVEMKGLPLRGLKQVGGRTQIVIDSGGATACFASNLQRALPVGTELSVTTCAEAGPPSFARNELLLVHSTSPSNYAPGKAAPVAPNPVPASTLKPAAAAAAVEENAATHGKVVALLDSRGVAYGSSTHAAVRTSEEAAEIRGATLASGAKAMLLSVKPSNEFVLAVISAAAKMDSKLIKKVGGFKSSRFASEEEVFDITGCVPGAVPPFGSVWGLKTYMDSSLQDQGSEINFNAGLRTHSMRMSVADYLRVEEPVVGEFS